MLVHPSLEAVRVRPVAAGEAVDADREDYCRHGFTDPGPFSGACRLPRIGQASVLCNGDHLLVCVVAGGRAWFAPVRQRPLAGLITSCHGTVAGITCDGDPAELSAGAQLLDDAIAGDEVLLGWAPLARQQRPDVAIPGAGAGPRRRSGTLLARPARRARRWQA